MGHRHPLAPIDRTASKMTAQQDIVIGTADRTGEVTWGGSNDFLFLDPMYRACEMDSERFDFGRIKVGTGSFPYKTHWGFEPKPLNYEYRLVRGRKVPDLTPLNPRLSPFVGLWKRLPLSLSRFLGPHIVRHLG